MDFTRGLSYGKAHRGVLFRRTFPELEELEIRAEELYPDLGGVMPNKQERTWYFPGGSTLRLRQIEHDKEVHRFQSHQYTWIGFDELTNWPTSFPYEYMLSRCRSAAGAPCRMRAAGNPGSVGHQWVKSRFITVAPPFELYADPRTGLTRTFIPATLEDNIALMSNDPDYARRLDLLPDHLREALRFGNWDVVAGAVFSELSRERHAVRPFRIEPSWNRVVAGDWGYARPYAIGWWAITNDGRWILYREMYGVQKNIQGVSEPDKGTRESAYKVAKRAFELSAPEGVVEIHLDPACWSKIEEAAPSIAERFEEAGWITQRANNDRLSGVQRVHELMQTDGQDGRPMLITFDTCTEWWRTFPVLPSSPKDPEDVDTTVEDHAYDMTRYAVMSESGILVGKPREGNTGMDPGNEWARREDERVARDFDPLTGRAKSSPRVRRRW